ncbi:MAG: ABC transporter permease [Clostridia bacterium]|nr:ABC transporter permease [Clostridia bacterium]
MNLFENIKMAYDSIIANKMRSFLTMLGIIIGISSVITIVSLGQGGQKSITGEFEKIGASSVIIRVNSEKAAASDYISTEDIRQLKEKVPYIKYASPTIQKQGNARSETNTKKAVLTGGNSDLKNIENLEMLYGRFFSESEVLQGSSIAVIDDASAKSLFGLTDATGKKISIGPQGAGKQVTVIGISKSQLGIFGGNNENIPAFVYVPFSFLQALYGTSFLTDSVTITATNKNDIELAGTAAVNLLESRHANRGREVYKADNFMKQLDQVNNILGIFTAFIGAVAAISLIVGGIGVMNIMLVSVTERTREIGIRKAIGARTRTILAQFLTESVIISLIGGILGLLTGLLAAYAIGRFAKITPSLSLTMIVLVVLFSSAVGIFFGIYPARKAARLDPIEALRYE